VAAIRISGFAGAGGIAGENGIGSGEFTLIDGCVVGGVGDITITGDSSNYLDSGTFQSEAGGIAGYNAKTIRNCLISGTGTVTIQSNLCAGGVVGFNDGSYSAGNGLIENCAVGGAGSVAVVTDSITYNGRAGGVAGENKGGVIKNCAVSSDVTVESSAANNAYLGGIVGDNHDADILSSYAFNAFGSISGAGTTKTGGIAGGLSAHVGSWNITSCAALQFALPSAVAAGRVTGEVVSQSYPRALLSGNYAYDGMTGGSGNTANTAQDGLDGADIAKSGLTRSFFETTLGWQFGADDEHPWVWSDANNLPIFYWMDAAQEASWQRPTYLMEN
jgi:hypothetical protein